MALKAFLLLIVTVLLISTVVSSDDIMDEKAKWRPFLRPFRTAPAKQPTEQSFIPKSRAPRPVIGLPKLPPLTFNIPLPGRIPARQQKPPAVQQPQVGQQPPVGEQQQPPVVQQPFPLEEGEFGPKPLGNGQIPNPPLPGNKVGEEELKHVMKGHGFSKYNMTLARPVTPSNRSFKARPVTPTNLRVKAPPVTPANLSVKA